VERTARAALRLQRSRAPELCLAAGVSPTVDGVITAALQRPKPLVMGFSGTPAAVFAALLPPSCLLRKLRQHSDSGQIVLIGQQLRWSSLTQRQVFIRWARSTFHGAGNVYGRMKFFLSAVMRKLSSR
jgi:hypothetical protein